MLRSVGNTVTGVRGVSREDEKGYSEWDLQKRPDNISDC